MRDMWVDTLDKRDLRDKVSRKHIENFAKVCYNKGENFLRK